MFLPDFIASVKPSCQSKKYEDPLFVLPENLRV